MDKLEIARRQLGTALALYLEDLDPVSVHSLASAACELLEHLASKAGKKPLNHYIISYSPGSKASDLRRIQHEFWNAFKHALRPDQRTEREDGPLLASFSDADNDHRLFVAWYDYANAAQQLPIEASLFLIWYQCAEMTCSCPNAISSWRGSKPSARPMMLWWRSEAATRC